MVNQRGAARLRGGHLWVYRSDIAKADAPAGSLVEVRDERGRRLGSALYSRLMGDLQQAATQLAAGDLAAATAGGIGYGELTKLVSRPG